MDIIINSQYSLQHNKELENLLQPEVIILQQLMQGHVGGWPKRHNHGKGCRVPTKAEEKSLIHNLKT